MGIEDHKKGDCEDEMQISNMLSGESTEKVGTGEMKRQGPHQQSYTSPSTQDQYSHHRSNSSSTGRAQRGSYGGAAGAPYGRGSPTKKDQKHVVFQLIDTEDPRIQARLPMRVMISPHDPTDSIITTVKNFYGLYDYGVSFENKEGISIIAAYDNFENDMVVYVRTVSQPPVPADHTRTSVSPKKATLGAPFEMRPPQLYSTSAYSRSAARSAGVRSISPQSDAGRRSVSAAPGGKSRTQRLKSKDNSVAGDVDGYSSGENGEGSVTSSRRSKTEQVNAEISVDNIVEGGRRKRAFESSELPLFVPPQVPMSASISSISPQRRSGPGNAASPYAYSNQQTFSYTQPLPSPQSYGSQANHMQSGMSGHGALQANKQLRARSSGSHAPLRYSNGILPTPDPTVNSVISDEDVALQLMRLGDPTAFSHGRTSTSTVDDALSGKADAASSDEEDADDEDEPPLSGRPAVPHFNDPGPQRKKQRTVNELPSDGTSGEEYEDHRDGTFTADGMPRHGSKSKAGKPRALSMNKAKSRPAVGSAKVPMSPASMPTQSRKGSIASTINFQHQLGADEDDLSSKPRCQRCRKSKKGCDRQRPCGRCKDAGIGTEGCISEDEGNGRKGRYGRHMGVPIKKGDEAGSTKDMVAAPQPSVPANGYFLAPALPDKSKKRKR